MNLIERTRQLRDKGLTFKEIINTCEREGLLDSSKMSIQALKYRFYKKYPSYKTSHEPFLSFNVKPKYREEVRAAFRRGLKDMGYTEREIKAEIKRLLK
jgi:hypothetical protein